MKLFIIGITTGLLLVSCATDAETKKIQTDIQSLQSQSRSTISDLEFRQKTTSEALETVLKNQADIKADLESLSKRIDGMTGEMEASSHYLSSASTELKALKKSNLPERLKALEKNFSKLRKSITDAGIAQSRNTLTIREEIEETFIALFNQVVAVRKILSRETVEEVAEKQPSGEETAELKPVPESIPPEELYRSANRSFLHGNYAQASIEFAEYVKRHPDTDLSDNSQYWLGESLVNENKLEEAVEAFNAVAENYPESTKSPTALMRMAELLETLGRKEDSLDVLKKIRDNYPDSVQAGEIGEETETETVGEPTTEE